MPSEPKFFGESLPYLKQFSLKGKLIVIEGTDGVGRSTQVSLLRNWLEIQGYAVVETGWARSNLMHKSIELAKSGNIMDRMTFTLLYATDFADRYENLILPALKSGSLAQAMLYGALLGFFTYMTYDLTNQATLRNWTTQLTLIDIAWGTLLGAIAATAGFWATMKFAA